jgi:CRISPR-associated protein Cas5d
MKTSEHKSVVDILVWGRYACFTRPEFKAERESYPVITPSAARGLLEAIYWKPQMRYRIQSIHIHRRGERFSLFRNELKDRQTHRAPKNGESLGINIDENRAQRHSLVLTNVAYRIVAWIDIRADEPEERIGKHLATFRRRTRTGSYHHRPVLGCREFAADFAPTFSCGIPEDIRIADNSICDDYGPMLFDTAYVMNQKGPMTFYQHANQSRKIVKGTAQRIFFKAKAEAGVISVPQSKYDELDQLEGKVWDSTRH